MMYGDNKVRTLIISLILTVSLVTSSFFVMTPEEVQAEEKPTASEAAVEQIEDLTEPADSNAEYDGYIVKIKDNKTGKVDESEATEYESTPDNQYVMIEEPEDALDFVDPDYIEMIEPNYKRTISETTSSDMEITRAVNAYEGGNKTQYNLVNVDRAWTVYNYTGSDTEVAVFDSGLNTAHSYLPNILKTYSFVNTYYYGGNALTTNVTDRLGHGTFVAGLIAANGSDMKGIAYNSSISAYKIFEGESGNVGDFLIALDALYKGGERPDVINMSFGGEGYANIEYDLIKKFTDSGSIVIAAAGNSGLEGSSHEYPANYKNVIGVGSVNPYGTVSNFSTKNSSVSVVAPGENMTSLSKSGTIGLSLPNRGNGYNCGTSYSAPIVAGTAALFDSTGITYRKFLTLIKKTSTDIKPTGCDINSGYGIINIGKMADEINKGVSNISNSYQIAYETGGGKISGSFDTIHTPGKASIVPKKVTKGGYTFSHWVNEKKAKITSVPSGYNSGDLKLTAVYKPKSYKLNFKGNGGKVKVKTKTVKYQTAISSLKTPKKRKGYNFLGWFTKKKGGTQYYKGKKYKKIGNLTLYAHWTKKKVVKFNANGGTVAKYAKAIKKGKKYGTLPKPTRSKYTFKGWYTKKKGGKKITKKSKVAKNKNYTLYARWKKK